MKIIILGAGPCGLGAAYHLNKLGHTTWQMFERNSHLGGLSASFSDDAGFTWDIGGHVLFSHYDYFDKVVVEALGDQYYEHQRESWIRILQRWVPYPFQNNVRYLPDEALKACVEGLRNLQGNPAQTGNFREWMDTVFGSGIVKHFMEPYNRKVWGVPLDTMSKDWIAERVSVIDLERIERNIAEGVDDLSWGPNNTFMFPKHGGTGAIYESIAGTFRDRIHLNNDMRCIDVEQKKITFSNGRVEVYDVLVNTTPLDLLVQSSSGISDQLRLASDCLVHNGALIVGLGFEGAHNDSKCWMYFPEPDSPFNVPDASRYFSLMCETTYSQYKPEEKRDIIETTIQGLLNSDMIDERIKKKIISRYMIDIPYSYPVPTVGRSKALKAIQPFLESKDIYSRGRFGAWKYEAGNMDHSFMQGVEVVDRILNGKPESVFNSK